MRGGHDAHIDGNRLNAAHRHDSPFLNAPQEFGLHGQRQLADFIQKQGPSVGASNTSERGGSRAGERALDVSEKLRLDQLAGKNGAVNRHEGLVGPATAGMNFAGCDFFADARFTFAKAPSPNVKQWFRFRCEGRESPDYSQECMTGQLLRSAVPGTN